MRIFILKQVLIVVVLNVHILQLLINQNLFFQEESNVSISKFNQFLEMFIFFQIEVYDTDGWLGFFIPIEILLISEVFYSIACELSVLHELAKVLFMFFKDLFQLGLRRLVRHCQHGESEMEKIGVIRLKGSMESLLFEGLCNLLLQIRENLAMLFANKRHATKMGKFRSIPTLPHCCSILQILIMNPDYIFFYQQRLTHMISIGKIPNASQVRA